MQKRRIERLKSFFGGDVLKECRERVVQENILMLCVINLAMGMFSIMFCGHLGVRGQDEMRFFNAYMWALFILSVVLLTLTRRVVTKRPKLVLTVIAMDYIACVSYIIAETAMRDSGVYMASYYVLIGLSCCFLIKPFHMILLQMDSAFVICAYLLLIKQPNEVGTDVPEVLIMMCISISIGLFSLWFRMKFHKRNEEREQILSVTALYQSILDETQTGVYVRELGTCEVLYTNRKAREIFSVDVGDAVGRKCYDLFYHQDVACQACPARTRNVMYANEREVVFGGRIYAVKGKIIDWSGREAYVEYLSDVTDARRVSEQMRLAHDSLERKYEEEVLYREKAVSEDVLASTRMNLTEGIVEEMRVGTQDGYEEQYRHKIEFTDRITAFCKNYWIMDEQKQRLSPESLLNRFKQGVMRVSEEYIAELKDGKHVWVRAEVSLVRRPETGEVIAFIYSRDITRERVLGHVLERIMSFEYDEIYTVDSKNNRFGLLAIGQYALDAQQIFGSYQEKLNSLVERAVTGEDKEKLRRELCIENMCKVLQKEQTHLLEVTLISRSGKARRKRVRCMYLYEDVGTVLVTITDIEDVVKAEKEKQEQLEEALRMAREANQEKSKFLANMSHEIRTPMNAIIGLNSIIKENISNGEQVLDCSDKLDSASKYLLALLNDILDMSRIESGNMVLAHQPFDGDKFWKNVNILANAQADMASVRYIFVRECEVSRVYLGDATRLQQIMINLINNAIKFTSENGYVKVSVSESETENGHAAVNVTVEDNGIGISEEFLPEVFGIFTQQYAESTTAYKGSGLGLSIARNFARMMGGDITVTSKEGVGTKFYVQVMLEIDREQSGVEEVEENEERMFDGKKVLLVEDHPLNTLVARSLLEKRGFTVVHAENGEEALQCFEESAMHTFDAVLMDIRMPIMDGIEATMRIRALDRADAKDVPIIAMTANAYEEDRRHTAEAGMNAHLAKPIEPKQLFRTLNEFIP